MQVHLQRNIREIENILKAADKCTLRLGSPLTAMTSLGRSERFKDLMDHTYIRLCQILKGNIELIDPWRSSDPSVVEHLENLQIPTIDHKPSLLLHRLGDVSEGNPVAIEELALREERLKSVFSKEMTEHDLEHSVLFNTSGAGKTRLALEGLCKEWGFYFTCRRDISECGSSDLDRVLGSTRRGYLKACGLAEHIDDEKAKSQNEACAERCFVAVLVARLLVLQCFLTSYEAQGKKTTTLVELKKIWLFVQLDRRLLEYLDCPDLLLELTTLLCYVDDASSLTTYCETILEECRLFLGTLVPRRSLFGDRQVHIFCVIDEVQIAASLFPGAFRGGPLGTDARPVLRALLQIWSTGMHFIITGTSLNIQHIQEAVSSTIGKHYGHIDRAITGTGSFIYKDEQIDNYLNYYIPSWYLNSPIGKELSRRARYWLIGRPRFIASFVQCLIIHNFQYCHQLLTSYIQAITNFLPTDGIQWEQLEDPMPTPSTRPLPSFDLGKAAALDKQTQNGLITSIQGLVNHRLLCGRTDFETSGEGLVDSKLVECGFARYPDGKEFSATFDEPLAYLAADTWISSHWASRHQYFLQRIKQNSPDDNGLEQYTAICLAHIFRQFTPLSDYFRFASNLGKPEQLENKRARLVSCWIDSSQTFRVAPVVFPFDNKVDKSYGYVMERTSSPSNILGYTSTTPADDLLWLNFQVNAPFLFPHKSCGPDLMLRLELEGGGFITVAVQIKFRENGNALTARDALKRAIKSVDPSKLWKNMNQKDIYHPNIHIDTLNALDKLENRYDPNRKGYHSMIGGIFAYPATDNEEMCKKVFEKLAKGDEFEFDAMHEFFMMPTAPIITLTESMPPFGGLRRMEDALVQRRVLNKLNKVKLA